VTPTAKREGSGVSAAGQKAVEKGRITKRPPLAAARARNFPRRFLILFKKAHLRTSSNIAPMLHLRAGMFSQQAGFQLSVEGPWAGAYILEASTNLASWTPVQTNADSRGTIYFLDATATNFGRRFYRAFYR
jgi:hypothetical protein